jgi:RHS repeat-associated protein
MLDNLNLVHMNGRVYDQIIGRFMSADPIVQVPGFTQSFNRYSYTFNNPLSYTDPSGFEIERPNTKCINECPKNPNFTPNLGMSIRTFWSEPTPRGPLPRPNPAPSTSRPVQPDETQVRPGHSNQGTNGEFVTGLLGGAANDAIHLGLLSSQGQFAISLLKISTGVSIDSSTRFIPAPESNLGQFGYDLGPGLTVLVSGGGGTAAKLERLAAREAGNFITELTVLGRYPDYIQHAQAVGANYFNLGKLGNLLPRGLVWRLNTRFLDRAIARGDRIVLSRPFNPLRDANSWLADEIAYLRSHGYTLSDGIVMVPP